uniref:Uncharacterized protein n=1 Tax=Tanacetum cinerariifolium TaxID=118510 RepID=A0A6L2NFF2_TANCI|nr:hypothetical protein [Tanacetum cinerariifolium]
MPNVDIPQGIDTGGSSRHQETIGGTSAQTRPGRVLEQPNEPPLTKGHTSGSKEGRLEENIKLMETIPTPHDLPLTRGYTTGSDEGRITLVELMETYTTLSNRVTQLENELSTTKAVYNKLFITLTNRVKKLESQLKQKRSSAIIHSSAKEGPSVHIKDSSKQERIIEEMDKDKNINLDQVHTFVPKDSKIERKVMKRAGFDLQQGSSKKQRLDQQTEETNEEAKAQGDSDQEVEELKLYMRIIPDEDIAIESIPLAIKPLVIIE